MRDDGDGQPLQHAHEHEEGDRVEDGADRDAVDEPLGERIPEVQLRLRLRARTGLWLVRRRRRYLLLEVARAIGAAAAGGGAGSPALVGGKGALEKLLPQVVGRRGQEGDGYEAQEVGAVEGQGAVFAVGLEDLGEDVRRARERDGRQRGFHHRRWHRGRSGRSSDVAYAPAI